MRGALLNVEQFHANAEHGAVAFTSWMHSSCMQMLNTEQLHAHPECIAVACTSWMHSSCMHMLNSEQLHAHAELGAVACAWQSSECDQHCTTLSQYRTKYTHEPHRNLDQAWLYAHCTLVHAAHSAGHVKMVWTDKSTLTVCSSPHLL